MLDRTGSGKRERACVECGCWKLSVVRCKDCFGVEDARAGARGAVTSVIPSSRESLGSGIVIEAPSSRSCDNKGACSRVVIVEKIQCDPIFGMKAGGFKDVKGTKPCHFARRSPTPTICFFSTSRTSLHFCFSDPYEQDAHCQYLNQFSDSEVMTSTKCSSKPRLPVEIDQQSSVHDFGSEEQRRDLKDGKRQDAPHHKHHAQPMSAYSPSRGREFGGRTSLGDCVSCRQWAILKLRC